MSRMFDNYATSDWVCNTDSSPVSLFNFEEYEGIKFLHDKKGNFYGIEAKYLKPFTLYFGLRDALAQDIDEYVQNGAIQLQFCSTGANSKIIFEKIFSGLDTFNVNTQALRLPISLEDAKFFKQETYFINLSLTTTEGQFPLFTQKDGLLVIR